jgi:hypothetical protein
MKVKIILLVVICAVITLSFTVISSVKSVKAATTTESKSSEPIGGFTAEDKL